ncbi:MAG: hypothetical protein ACTSPB_23905 [Candidatus Thorarchaeota archaeon]
MLSLVPSSSSLLEILGSNYTYKFKAYLESDIELRLGRFFCYDDIGKRATNLADPAKLSKIKIALEPDSYKEIEDNMDSVGLRISSDSIVSIYGKDSSILTNCQMKPETNSISCDFPAPGTIVIPPGAFCVGTGTTSTETPVIVSMWDKSSCESWGDPLKTETEIYSICKYGDETSLLGISSTDKKLISRANPMPTKVTSETSNEQVKQLIAEAAVFQRGDGHGINNQCCRIDVSEMSGSLSEGEIRNYIKSNVPVVNGVRVKKVAIFVGDDNELDYNDNYVLINGRHEGATAVESKLEQTVTRIEICRQEKSNKCNCWDNSVDHIDEEPCGYKGWQ